MTIKELAKACNVSSSAVSKALNGYTDINPQTKNLIIQKAKELGYIPNHYARSLSTKKKNKVAFIVKSSRNKSFIDELTIKYTTSIFKYAHNKLDIIILFDDIFKERTIDELIIYLKSLNIGGIILFGINQNKDEFYSFINNPDFKTVIIDIPIKDYNTSSIAIDDCTAQYLIAKQVIDTQTDKHLLYLSGPKDDILAQKRLQGIQQFSNENNLNLIVFDCQYQDIIAYNIVLKHHNFDCFICANDMMAIGCAKALSKLNIQKKVSGFDGIALINYIDYPIYTVVQNIEKKSQLAINEMIRLFNNEESRIVYDTFTISKNKSIYT
ncbi:MAG: LacI family DNA-binding transcriptional regulator [Mycoplasmatales bacterium]